MDNASAGLGRARAFGVNNYSAHLEEARGTRRAPGESAFPARRRHVGPWLESGLNYRPIHTR